MNQLEIIDALKSGLMWVCLGGLLLIAAACAFVGLRRVGKALCVRLSPAAIGVFAVAAIVATGEAQKRQLRDGGSGSTAQQVVVTPEEIAQGWRLESVVTNDAVSYSIPTNGVEYMPWSLGGGYEAHFVLDFGEFAFPFGTGVVRRIDVVSGGMVESLPRQRAGSPLSQYVSMMSICAAREYASIVPGVSRFWWADTARSASAPYRVKLISWENIFGGRDCTGQYSAQIEFHDDGNYITRSNTVERTYRRVLPYDLDNDGLPNSIDPLPEVPLVPSGWNQSEAWAAAAFPSNADEIAAMGGYAAWVAAQGTEPERRLVSLGVTFDDGSVWPTLLEFGGVPVMADGAAELTFAIDCGARVPFTLTAGRLASVEVTATGPPMRSGEGGPTTSRELFPALYSYPYERMVGDVKVHFDGPRSGWICRIAGVNIDNAFLPHLFPGDFAELTATISTCHSNAYFGCTWHGGAGIIFSSPHSLSTTVTYDPDDPDDWATNGIDLVTQFVGYSLTNHVCFTVGVYEEPPLQFSLGCQKVFFLNDADFLEGECPSNRPERIRPVTLNLVGPLGTNGTARLSVQGGVNPVLFHVINGVTNRVTSETEFPLAVTNDFEHTASYTVYVSCPNLGTGTITATFTPADGGTPLTDSVTFRCIEPLRKLVTTEKSGGLYVNPSRLVLGTNAVLKVSANGPFSPSEVNWRVVSGPGCVSSTNGWETTVTPTGLGTVIVEARFNDDEIQPRFVLPIVQPRTIPVKVVVIEPPERGGKDVEVESDSINAPWTNRDIFKMLNTANGIFTQVGIRFELIGVPENVGRTNDWILPAVDAYTNSDGKVCLTKTVSRQAAQLFYEYEALEGVTMYFVGAITNLDAVCFRSRSNVVVGKESPEWGLAHELGHYLGLKDIYYAKIGERDGKLVNFRLGIRNNPVSFEVFKPQTGDWGDEMGRGFYERDDTIASIIARLLMFGVEKNKPNDVGDIPDCPVYGISRDNQKGFQNVGASNLDN